MKRAWLRLFAAFILGLPLVAQAVSIDDLIARDELRISTELSTTNPLIATQELKLWIDIKTQTWFAGGSRILLPEIAHTVVSQPSAFAINSSTKQAGITWTVQRWALTLYPQQAGPLAIPSIQVDVAINLGEAGIVRGKLYTAPTTINVVLPAGEQDTKGWLATPAFTVERRFSPRSFSAQQGESLQLVVTSRAENLMPMMLPPYPLNSTALNSTSLNNIDGIAIYPHLPELEHKTQRGDNTAIRRDRVDIVIEREGEYQLPAVEYRWWNTQLGEMQHFTLPALALVSGEAVVELSHKEVSNLSFGFIKWLAVAMLLSLLAAMFWWYQHARNNKDSALSQRQLQHCVHRALKQGNAPLAVHYLYRWLACYQAGSRLSGVQGLRDVANTLADASFSAQLETVLAAAYDNPSKTRALKSLKLQFPHKNPWPCCYKKHPLTLCKPRSEIKLNP